MFRCQRLFLTPSLRRHLSLRRRRSSHPIRSTARRASSVFRNLVARGCRAGVSAPPRRGRERPAQQRCATAAGVRGGVSMKAWSLVLSSFMLVALTGRAEAQNASVRVEVRGGGAAIPGAAVVVNGVASTTDDRGVASAMVTRGRVEIVVAKEGFEPVSLSVEVRAAEERTVTVDLQPQSEIAEHVTVSATRTERGIEDEPMRVEVLDRDEIEEKLMMTPGDIVMMLNEMGGLRVQATSPSLGAASIRIQGMRGRYTRFLSDGLPLSGEQVGSFGLLQIPPVDLGRVEVIKGVASSLYGAGAMGGVVNLVSRKAGREPEREFLLNRSTRGTTDGVLWYATPLSPRWGLTMLGGGHWQEQSA